MLASTVSSKILRTMSKIDGFKYVETLTGFKWIGMFYITYNVKLFAYWYISYIGNKAHEIMLGHRKKVIFGFEEAIGFMWNTAVLDKDGIQAGVHLATLAAYLDHHAITLTAHLDEIYQEYGYHLSLNSYFTTHDTRFFHEIFNKLRNFEGAGVVSNLFTQV